MKLDILVFAAHPDDAELSCSGTIASHITQGKKVGLVDLTAGELGTRGNVVTRAQEAEEATKILGLAVRENLGFADGFFTDDRTHQLAIIAKIRKYRPEVVLANAIEDRHIDHGRASNLVHNGCFLSGLPKIETQENNQEQSAWRPKALYHYIQDRYIRPTFVVDITPYWEVKLASIRAYKTQFFNPGSKEPDTPISSSDFLYFLEARARDMGRLIGVTFGEGFTKATPPGVKSLFDLI